MMNRLYIFFAILGIGLFCAPASARQDALAIDAGDANHRINHYAAYYLEDGAPLEVETVASAAFEKYFAPSTTSEPDFGYFTKGIWLKIPLRNAASSEQSRILVMHTNFMRTMAVYLATPDGVQTLLKQDPWSAFGTRAVAYHELAAPFTLKPGQEGVLYIRYTSEGSTMLPLSLETPLSFATAASRRITIDFVFYGIMAMFIIASIAGRLFWRNPTFVAYGLYASSVLLYIFQRDGYAFQYLWPGAPEWNNFSSLPIGASLPILAAFFTRAYLRTKTIHPLLDRALIAIVVMQLLVIASAAFIGPSAAKKVAVLTTTLSILIFFGIGIAAYRAYGRRTLFFVAGWFGILCASLIMSVVHWVNVDISRALSLDVMRVAMVFDAFMMGLASVFSIVDLQRDKEKLDQERIAVLDSNLQLHSRLARLEQKYHLAQSIAETHSRLLVDTTHDLRQPLYALRAAMGEIVLEKASRKRMAEIEHSLNYIEELVEAALEKAIEDDEAGAGGEENQPEVIELNKLFSALQTMFEADAEKHKVAIKVMPTRLTIESRPFPVLRIMTNFVSNAIRYGAGGRVVIGARRCGDYVLLEVHDTGPGMSADELEQVRQRYARGAAADEKDAGKGVGLSIVDKLAAEEKLRWTLQSRPGRGTVAKLFAPRGARPPSAEVAAATSAGLADASSKVDREVL